jgi:hypothetical protein
MEPKRPVKGQHLDWVDRLKRVEPLLIEAELLHAGLCLGLMCSPKVKSEKRNKTEKDRIKLKRQK